MADRITTDKGFWNNAKTFPSGVRAELESFGPIVFGNISECKEKMLNGLKTDVIKGENVRVYGTDKDDSIFFKGEKSYINSKGGNDTVTADGERITVEGAEKVILNGNRNTVIDDKHKSDKRAMNYGAPVYLDLDKIDEYKNVKGLSDKDLAEVQEYAKGIENNGKDNQIKIKP